jgi:cysteine protease ATG4
VVRVGVVTREVGCIEEDEVLRIMDGSAGVVLVVPLRLGLDRISPQGQEDIRHLLSAPWSLGAVGGQPRHSVWFIGVAQDRAGGSDADAQLLLLYVDPHTVRRAADDAAGLDAFRGAQVRAVPADGADPTIAVAFALASPDDLAALAAYLAARKDGVVQVVRRRATPSPDAALDMAAWWTSGADAAAGARGFEIVHEDEAEADGFVVL